MTAAHQGSLKTPVPCLAAPQRLAASAMAMLFAMAGSVAAQAQGTSTFQLTAVSSGSWNSAGTHTLSSYQIGHSNDFPNNRASYFEFDLDPVQGRALVSAFLQIPGSANYNISTVLPSVCGSAPCFKLGIAPQGPIATDAIVNPLSNNNTYVYQVGNNEGRNQDLGYTWLSDGLHPGLKFDADQHNAVRLQAEMNAGGHWVFWARDRFYIGEGAVSGGECAACPGGFENYIWGQTSYNTSIVLFITVANGPRTTAVVQNGTYQIGNLNSGLVLEVPAGQSASGTHVNQAIAVAGAANQQWTVTRLDHGNYTISNVATGLFLEVPNASSSPGEAIDVALSTGQENQQWIFSGTNDGDYSITNANSGLPLGVASALTLPGAGVDQFKPTGNADQQWSFR